MEKEHGKPDAREGKMHTAQTTVKYQSIVNTFRLYHAADESREIGYAPLRLGVKTIGVKSGFYHELLNSSCRMKVSPTDMLRYLWRTRDQISFEVFSQN
jgi:hypothetical protein